MLIETSRLLFILPGLVWFALLRIKGVGIKKKLLVLVGLVWFGLIYSGYRNIANINVKDFV